MNLIEAWRSGVGQVGDWFFNDVINGGINLLNGILGGLGNIISDWLTGLGMTFSIPTNVFAGLKEIGIGVGYIIPVRALLPIPMFILSFYIAKLIFAIYQLIAGLIIKRVKLHI